MTHAWLITGPPGSGRSTLAHAFAAELVGAGDSPALSKQVVAGAHPDVSILATDRVTITIEEVRALVAFSYFSPSQARYRVVVMEDADRMTERTSNVLLKALEEPPPQTVWILCAPSPADVLPTIRSRMRSVNLLVPGVDDVAELISRREGVDEDLARLAATEAQKPHWDGHSTCHRFRGQSAQGCICERCVGCRFSFGEPWQPRESF